MRVVCYKAIFRNSSDPSYDTLYPPECGVEGGAEFICFKDVSEPTEENGWKILPARFHADSPRLRARLHKANSHILFPDADFTLWLDGTFTPLTPLSALAVTYGASMITTFRHPHRSCVYVEAQAVIRRQKDDPRRVRRAIKHYKAMGFPRNHGLAETGAMLRKNCPLVAEFNERWSGEIQNRSVRDQISFDVIRWVMKMPARYFPGTSKNCPHFRFRPHHGRN